MSKYLPIENIVYKTRYSKEDAIARLIENVEKEKSFGFGVNKHNYSKPYIGYIIGNTFEIKRAINYRNSFLPCIKGEIYTDYDGTKVKVNMKPAGFVLLFIVIWLGGIAMMCIITTFALFTQKFNPFFLIPYGMLIFGITLFYGAFKIESSASKKDLQRIFEAEIEP